MIMSTWVIQYKRDSNDYHFRELVWRLFDWTIYLNINRYNVPSNIRTVRMFSYLNYVHNIKQVRIELIQPHYVSWTVFGNKIENVMKKMQISFFLWWSEYSYSNLAICNFFPDRHLYLYQYTMLSRTIFLLNITLL